MEKVILNHLENVYDIHNKLNVNQHTFRKGSSCDSALSDMVDEIDSSIFHNQYALAIFLDIRGAYIRGLKDLGNACQTPAPP